MEKGDDLPNETAALSVRRLSKTLREHFAKRSALSGLLKGARGGPGERIQPETIRRCAEG